MIENIYKRQADRQAAGQPLFLPGLCVCVCVCVCVLPIVIPLGPPSAFQIFNKAPTQGRSNFFHICPGKYNSSGQLFLLARLEARDIRALAIAIGVTIACQPAVYIAKCQGLADAIQFFMHLPHLVRSAGA